MRILILGGDGMLGHRLFQSLRSRHDAKVTLRKALADYESFGLFDERSAFDQVEVLDQDRLLDVFSQFRPEAVVNCIGIVKQRSTAKESIPSLEINALLPHRLALLCKAAGARLVHLSTDCVFSGKTGNYRESDPSDAEDLYGKSKFLGEVHDGHCLTLRTSIIGRELSRNKSLLEWFLAQSGSVKGFKNAIYTGFATYEMSRIIETMLTDHPEASGVYQVSSDPISKYDLLILVKKMMDLDVEIIPDRTFVCDRSLNSDRFRAEFNYQPPSWEEMIRELAKDGCGE